MIKLLESIDGLLNRVTMYRLTLHFLSALAGAALLFSVFGILPYNTFDLAFSFSLLILVSWISNKIFSISLKTPANIESFLISALILGLIMPPVSPSNLVGTGILIFVGVVATASKYVLVFHKKHVFNPVAVAVFATAIFLGHGASWWVGASVLSLFVLIGGLLVVRKLRHADMIIGFFIAWVLALAIFGGDLAALAQTIKTLVVYSPVLFFVFVMFTEPLTTPPTRALRISYGVLTGVLLGVSNYISSPFSAPEVVLIISNLFSFIVSPNGRLILTLEKRVEVARNTFDFLWRTDRQLNFRPGQYLEWTLPVSRADNRGNRRYFTIASSPTEPNIRIGIKFPDTPSSFKKELLGFKPGSHLAVHGVAGDFTLPENRSQKLAFLAGGIGITPFRSMVKYLLDRNEKRDIVVLYSAKSDGEVVYRPIFDEAASRLGIRTKYVITQELKTIGQVKVGVLDQALIKSAIPDFASRVFFVSGPNFFVTAMTENLRDLGVPKKQIKRDFFPGYV